MIRGKIQGAIKIESIFGGGGNNKYLKLSAHYFQSAPYFKVIGT